MKSSRLAFSLHGLRAQVLLWIVLPVTILMIVFSLSGIQSHQSSMRALAGEENWRLALALAQAIALEAEIYALRQGGTPSQSPIDVLGLVDLLDMNHPNAVTTFLLLDDQGRILFGRGHVPAEDTLLDWPGVAEALTRDSGVLFTTDTPHGDVVAYAPVPNTPWVLIIREPWHSITDPLIRFEQVMPFVLITAVIVSFLILFFGLRYVVRPLHELSQRIDHVGQGDFSALDGSAGGVREIEDLRSALAEMAHRVKNYQAALHNYLGAITSAQEEERARLARELHDETVQTLIALGHKAQMVQRSYLKETPQTEAHIGELREMIAGAISEVRRFSRALRPAYLEELGLLSALQILAQEAGAAFRLEGTAIPLASDKELVLYRVGQEALNNALRHAHADQIAVHLTYGGAQVSLCIQDNGDGFQVPSSYALFTQHGHFGVMSMSERALQAQGELKVQSAPGQGTQITITLPLIRPASDDPAAGSARRSRWQAPPGSAPSSPHSG